jgi:hypothetical protein
VGSHSDNAKEEIIDAAESLVIESSARHLTLDAVGLRFEPAAVIELAAAGIKFLELFSTAPFDDDERTNIIETMIALSKAETND